MAALMDEAVASMDIVGKDAGLAPAFLRAGIAGAAAAALQITNVI
ncbi:hypothetical protein [Rhodanobacter geophilus]|uniref:Uncharacterized protein n=1 Tax=Rhodanobacter geophilus TaxID=3162488 RepID=A0ABV3QK08_9GAMM